MAPVMVAAASRLVLLTGFAAFDHKTDNPSGDVARALNGTCIEDVCFTSLVLEVNSDGASTVAKMLSEKNVSSYDAVIQMGEDIPGQFMHVHYAHIELVSANMASYGLTDANGPIISGAQDFLPATWDASAAWPVASRNDTIWHRDAGHYYCNEAFFRTVYAIRAANITAPGRPTSLLPSVFLHLPPPDVLPTSEGRVIVTALAQTLEASAPHTSTSTPSTAVLLGGFADRVGPDRGGAAVLALNGTRSKSGRYVYQAVLMSSDEPGALAALVTAAATGGGTLPWGGILLVAEQEGRLQRGLALQTVAYKRGSGARGIGAAGDEDEDVLPTTADLSKESMNADPDAKGGDAQLIWTRDNAEIGASGDAYYMTLKALHACSASAHAVPALLASLPFEDRRSAKEDAALVEGVVERMLQ